jgi:hypothetical protein
MESPQTPTPKEILKKKLRQKRDSRKHGTKVPDFSTVGDGNIFDMLNQVNKMLKENPEMVKRVSKCVNSVFENKSLLESLVKEINTSEVQDQTFASSSSSVSCDASNV